MTQAVPLDNPVFQCSDSTNNSNQTVHSNAFYYAHLHLFFHNINIFINSYLRIAL